MTIKQRCGPILALGLFAACLAGATPVRGQEASSGFHVITMTAKKFEFDPDVITVKKGEKVRLLITAADHDQGIKIDGYDINQALKKGETETIEFTADKPGTFSFKCSVYCGHGHGKMKGKLVVEE